MTTWKRTDSDPITTDSFVLVENEKGERGRVAVAQRSPGKVQIVGPVYRITVKYGSDGTPESEEKTILDRYPQMAD